MNERESLGVPVVEAGGEQDPYSAGRFEAALSEAAFAGAGDGEIGESAAGVARG